MKTLKEARIGDTVTVLKLHGEGAVKRRIMDHGHYKGRGGSRAEGRSFRGSNRSNGPGV